MRWRDRDTRLIVLWVVLFTSVTAALLASAFVVGVGARVWLGYEANRARRQIEEGLQRAREGMEKAKEK